MENEARILIVDVDPKLIENLNEVLDAKGFEVEAARRGKEALKLCRHRKFDIALVNISLPDMDGIEVIDRIKDIQTETDPIIITGHKSHENTEEILKVLREKRVAGYTVKPPDANRLLTLIEPVMQRKKAEKELRRSEERFRELTELLPEIVFETDERGILTFISRKASEATGYSQEELDNGFKAADLFVEGERARARKDMVRIMKGDAPVHAEYTVRRKDGSTFPVIMRSAPVTRGGKPSGLRGILIDVTEKMNLEDQLRQSFKMGAIGQLAGGIAHDFNNLLTGIIGHAKMIKTDAVEGSPLHEAVTAIENAVYRATELTGQLLSFARRSKPRTVPVDMHKVIHEVVSLLKHTIKKKIRIYLDLAAPKAVVHADPGQMHQVVLNLAVNARDAMSQGGRLDFKTKLVELDKAACATLDVGGPGRYLVLSIMDNGCGVPPGIIDRIFEPFFTTKEHGKGTGMGLAIVCGTVKNHDGTIRVHSELNKGTTFEIYLPLAEATETDGLPQAQNKEPLKGTGCILLVDDEPIILQVASAMLRSLGYQVITAGNGAEAVACYRKSGGKIDLAIIDLEMPEMDGHECFRAIRQICPEAKAILTTGYNLDQLARASLEMGMVGFIAKPFELSQLSAAIQAALTGKGNADLLRP